MKIALCAITGRGVATAERLAAALPDAELFNLEGKGRLRRWTEENFHRYDGHIFIMSMGIVYRIIAPLITDKYRDPAVVVVDDAARFAIAALSGHEGGANDLAFRTARILDAQPVVTTASDTNRRITMGVGCRKGIAPEAVEAAVRQVLAEQDLTPHDIRVAASADVKREEAGLIRAFEALGIPLLFLSSERIRNFSGYSNVSEAAMRQLGLPGVSEPCALLVGREAVLIRERVVVGGVTIALALEDGKKGL